ncbi:hypothetical protein CB0940_05415 [Cercospora beticola]|uniref:Uncharacterized protein n=1 Tax=Cercospora beticola TaxID=122368 RepID=A0A023PJJ3_CERBT|nr:hypothetical protein CB0940_05415 [Cercospora beticola]AHX24197.1 hypothetical protein [Cercospora beticola]PIA97611.1 hypothetical protein CB0940_05415 [Cercospora beticola]WPA97958.1 hypothetical protein RHO25_002569 [Cercospora beticola]
MAATDELKRQLLEIERLCDRPEPPPSGFTPATRTRKICDSQSMQPEQLHLLEALYREELAVENRLQESVRARATTALRAQGGKASTWEHTGSTLQRGIRLSAQECADVFRGRQEALKRGVDNLTYARALVPQPPASLPQFEIPKHAREMLEAYYTKFGRPEENEVSMLASALDLGEDDVVKFYDTVIDNTMAQEKMSKMLLKKIGQESARLSR